MALLGMSSKLSAADNTEGTTDKVQLQANHIGSYNDGTFTWWIYLNDNEYYAKCYLGKSTVTVPEWASSVMTIPATVTLTDGTKKVYALPTVFVFQDRPDKYETYHYSKTVGNRREEHDLTYTIEDQGRMATVYNVVANNNIDAAKYSASNPLVLTVPETVDLTTTTGTITNVTVTRLGVTQTHDNLYSHLGDAISTLGVPVSIKMNSNIQAIMANTFRVNDWTKFSEKQNDYSEDDTQGCSNLYGFDFNGNNNLWYIGKGAFQDATNLKLYPISENDDHAVAVPTSLTQLQDYAFANSGIRSLIVTQPIENLGNNVFENCDNMEYVSFKQLNMKNGDGTTNEMLLSRDIESFKKGLTKATVDYSNVKGEYQRLLQAIPNHVLVYAPNSFDQNYRYLDKSYNGYNIITTKDETPHCYHFYVYDNKKITGKNNNTGSYDYWVPEAFKADTCTYNREFPTGWVTTYLPFDWTLPEGCEAYQAAETIVSKNDKGQTLFTFTKIDGTDMKANTPYLLNNKSGNSVNVASTITANPGLAIPKSVHPSSKTFKSDNAATKATFWGTTEDIANDSAAVDYHAYNIREDQKWGKVVKSIPTGYIGHFRAFVSDARTDKSTFAKPNVVLMFIEENGHTTSITTADVTSLTNGNAAIYALDGRYMGTDFTRLPNGIYIKNGKKFTVNNR